MGFLVDTEERCAFNTQNPNQDRFSSAAIFLDGFPTVQEETLCGFWERFVPPEQNCDFSSWLSLLFLSQSSVSEKKKNDEKKSDMGDVILCAPLVHIHTYLHSPFFWLHFFSFYFMSESHEIKKIVGGFC